MKRIAFLFALVAAGAALADTPLVATGVGARTWHVGALGTTANVRPNVSRTFAPFRIAVTNAIKRTQETSSVFVPTNYVVTASVTTTNATPNYVDLSNQVTRIIRARDWGETNVTWGVWTNLEIVAGTGVRVTNYIVTATLTNAVRTLDGLDALWTACATNGITHTVTNVSTAAAGGTVRLVSQFGDEWTLALADGCGTTNCTWDVTRLVMPGGLRVIATDAETLDIAIHYLTFAE